MQFMFKRAAFVGGFVWELRWPAVVFFLAGMALGIVFGFSPAPA